MTAAVHRIAPRRRVAKGPRRPRYLAHPEHDRIMMMLTALVGEVSALRERIDTHEALGDRGERVTRSTVKHFTLTEPEQATRSDERDRLLQRVFRILLEELESARGALSTGELEEVLRDDGTELPDDQRSGQPDAETA